MWSDGFLQKRFQNKVPDLFFLCVKNADSCGVLLSVTLTTDDLSKELLRCVSKERGTAHQELVEDDPHGPPVYWLPIALSEDHLWGDVLWCTTHLVVHTEGKGQV